MVEPPDSHGMVITSTAYMNKVFDIIHMIWIDHNYDVTTILVSHICKLIQN